MFSNKDKMCRTCLMETEDLIPLFDTNVERGLTEKNSSLAELISSMINTNLDNNGQFPDKICKHCERMAVEACMILNQIKQNEKILKNEIKAEESFPENDDINEFFFNVTAELAEESVEFPQSESENIEKTEIIEPPMEVKKTRRKRRKKTDSDNLKNNEPVDETEEGKVVNELDIKYIKRTKRNPDGTYSCLDCDKLFPTATLYKRHMKTSAHNTGTEIFRCDMCPKTFIRKGSLQVHSRLHRPEKFCLCPYCGKSIPYASSLTAHLKLHTGERPFKCEVCGKSFSHKSYLTVHTRIHTGEKPFVCDVCGKGFIKRQRLTYHTRIHNSDRPYKCTYCDKAFTQPNTLTLHIRKHTGDKPYICNICEKGFTNGTALRIHFRSKAHNEKTATVTTDTRDIDKEINKQ